MTRNAARVIFFGILVAASFELQVRAQAPVSQLQVGLRGFSVLDYGTDVGAGGDDSAAINAAIHAAVNAKGGPAGGIVFFPDPPSGHYSICANPIQLPSGTDASGSVTLAGVASGAPDIRVLPGCPVPPLAVIVLGVGTQHSIPKSALRVAFENLRIDGYCQTDDLHINYGVAFQSRNTVYRNAARGGQNILITSGYENNIDFSNRVENVNDENHACYKENTKLPNYNIKVLGTDNHISAIAVNAFIANYYQGMGGNNDFSHAHGWGYNTPNTDGQPDLRPKYNFLIKGSATLIGVVADSFTRSGVYLAAKTDDAGVDQSGGQLIGSRCEAAGGTSGQCIELDNRDGRLKHWIIVGNNTQGIGNGGLNPIKIDGNLDGSNVLAFNSWVEVGASCNGPPTPDFRVANGIVKHC